MNLKVEDCYEVLTQVKGSVGGDTVNLGQRGQCRFCGCTDPKKFRMVAHTFPEALGNKWVVSLDEYDDCNSTFSAYDDALAKSIGPILTLGGVKGKANHVRQTGRSSYNHIRHNKDDRRRLEVPIQNAKPEDHFSVDPASGKVRMEIPVPHERFVPRLAHKCLDDKIWCTIADAQSAAERGLLSVPLDLNTLIPVP